MLHVGNSEIIVANLLSIELAITRKLLSCATQSAVVNPVQTGSCLILLLLDSHHHHVMLSVLILRQQCDIVVHSMFTGRKFLPYIHAGVWLMLGDDKIENHSFLRFNDVRTGSPLLCVSDNTDCCTEDNANWFLPGSNTPLTTSSSPYSVSRSTNASRYVALMRSTGFDGADRDDDDGLYRCEIIDTDESTKVLYVWLDANEQGN